MDPVQTVAIVLAFVVFISMSAVAHLLLAPTPVPVRMTPEPSVEALRNQLYI
jgi:hypothetical protein